MSTRKMTPIAAQSETNVAPAKTGTWRKHAPEHRNRLSPCTDLCPCAENIPAWMHLVRDGKFADAWQELIRENPFPLACGRVCYRFCEEKCNRGSLDDRVAINAVERFLGEYAATHGLMPAPSRDRRGRGMRVAIVGAGPSGLAAAYFLSRSGARVTLYDEHEELGGMLRYGIPEYRLPKALLAQELAAMLGSRRIAKRLGKKIDASTLAKIVRTHRYVLFAHGAHRPRAVVGPAGAALALEDGLAFLARAAAASTRTALRIGERVCVVGGGNTAIDVARTALRLGARSVTIVYRRERANMPAHADEIAEAKREGVAFLFRTLPVGVRSEGGRMELICAPAVTEADGTIVPSADPEDRFVLPADRAIAAIGETSDWGYADAWRAPEDARAEFWSSAFAASGDAATGPRSVSEAIASGKKAAQAILADWTATAPSARSGETVGAEEIAFCYLPIARRDPSIRHPAELTREEFVAFGETTRTIGADMAVVEASRCINCGTCIACDRCVVFCPDYAITRTPEGTYTVDLDMCKGCGLCADVCERAAIVFGKEEDNENA